MTSAPQSFKQFDTKLIENIPFKSYFIFRPTDPKTHKEKAMAQAKLLLMGGKDKMPQPKPRLPAQQQQQQRPQQQRPQQQRPPQQQPPQQQPPQQQPQASASSVDDDVICID